MAISEESRHTLYTRLQAVLGHEAAATLMAHLPPVGWADVATKHDLAALEGVLRSDVEALLHRELRDLFQKFIFANFTLMATLVGLTYAAVRLG